MDEAEKTDRSAKPWLDMLKEAEQVYEPYQKKCESIEKLYADLKALSAGANDREFQIFWANLEILKPTIYTRPPQPVVTPRFRDRKPLPRRAADLLERALQTDVEVDDLHSTLTHVRDDLASGARGVAWVRDFDGQASPTAEHVDREDFRHAPARKWKEVPWVARRAWLDRYEFRKRFPEADLAGITFEKRGAGADDDDTGEKKAEVWELWHKPCQGHERGVVVWVTPGSGDAGELSEVLDMQEPWLQLDGFFPCPRPAFGTLQPRTLIPVPDFLYYKDQVEEINELTARISGLAEALRLVGFYPKGQGDVGEAIQFAFSQADSTNAKLIPVTSMAALGGASLKDSIIWLPVREVAEVIAQLVELRRQLIDDVYQITGLSDIMRGATDPKETLGAQQLKSQYGNIRVRDRQMEMARIARDVIRIKAEILAETADPEVLLELSQVDDLPKMEQVAQQVQQAQAALPQLQAAAQQGDQNAAAQLQQLGQQMQEVQGAVTLEQVMELLRNQRLRPFVLDIETDSTIQPDENAEKERRVEAVTALGTFISQAGEMVAAEPALADFAGETLKFLSSGFRMGRTMDTAIDELVEKLKGRQQQQGPSPEQVKAEAEQARMQAELQMKQAEMQMSAEADRAKLEMDQSRAQMDMQAKAAEMGFAREKHALEVEKLRLELGFKREAAEMDLAHKSESAEIDVAKRKAMAEAKPKEAKDGDG